MADQKLLKKLKLFDVYAVSTGAMFSSGFFLLPGIAAFETGNSVYMAYLVAGILIIPSLFSVAELSTAMPKAGGAYYFLDRSLGPLMGTVGGIGSWLALIFKSAFALIGMGAYLTIYVDVPMVPLAVVLTIAFGLINIFGAKETAFLQRLMVAVLVLIMVFFVIQGLQFVYNSGNLPERHSANFLTNGVEGFVFAIGLVFVSFAGLTKVASIAEEVKNPDKTIPLGMILSLLTAVLIYVLGTYIMVRVLPAEEFFESLTPVADASRVTLDFLPNGLGVLLVVIAAIAAFASTGNAGLMSASRYPLAMSRDGLVGKKFKRIGKFDTPHYSVIATTLVMIVILLLFNVKGVAKLASAFQLLLFCLLNLAVIVMRESHIEAYKPGFKSPLYPGVQIFGMFVSLWLVAQMGLLAVGFTGTLILLAVAWYFYYVHGKVKRQGAIFHVHARLGRKKDNAIERELMTIINEKNVRSSIIYQKVIARSIIVQHKGPRESSSTFVARAEQRIAERLNVNPERLNETLFNFEEKLIELKKGVFFTYYQSEYCQVPEMLAAQSREGVEITIGEEKKTAFALLFLVTPQDSTLLRMRIIGHLAELIEAGDFVDRWREAKEEKEVKSLLLSEDRFVHVQLEAEGPFSDWIGKALKDINLPGESLISMVEREGEVIIPKGGTSLYEADVLFILGYPDAIEDLKQRATQIS